MKINRSIYNWAISVRVLIQKSSEDCVRQKTVHDVISHKELELTRLSGIPRRLRDEIKEKSATSSSRTIEKPDDKYTFLSRARCTLLSVHNIDGLAHCRRGK